MRTLGGTIFAAVISLAALAGDRPSEPHLRGSVSESSRYESLHPWFAKAFAFMRRPDLGDLPCGRYEIDGTNCWAMVQEVSLKPFAEENQYEVHRAFIDIQAPITGCETIGVATPDPKVFEDFNVEKDYVLFAAKGEPWTLKPGEFAIFFPERGAHAPRTLVRRTAHDPQAGHKGQGSLRDRTLAGTPLFVTGKLISVHVIESCAHLL